MSVQHIWQDKCIVLCNTSEYRRETSLSVFCITVRINDYDIGKEQSFEDIKITVVLINNIKCKNDFLKFMVYSWQELVVRKTRVDSESDERDIIICQSLTNYWMTGYQ